MPESVHVISYPSECGSRLATDTTMVKIEERGDTPDLDRAEEGCELAASAA